MEPKIKNVVVLGASGSVGSVVISSLERFGFHLSVVTLISIFKEQDAVISVIAAKDVTVQINAIDAAIAAGVKRFLPSEYGGDTSLPEIEKFTPFARGKKEVLSHLKSKEIEGLTWTALYTGPFFDSLLEIGEGLIGWEIENQKVTIFDSGNQRFDTTNINIIGKAMVEILRNPDITRNQQVYISSFKINQNEVVSALERLMGKPLIITRASSIERAERGRLATRLF